MKRIFLLLCISFLVSGLTAQSQAEAAPAISDTMAVGAEFWTPERVVYEMSDLDKPPVFPGGEREMNKFITINLHFSIPEDYQGSGCTVVILFVIEPDGSISNKEVLRCKELSEPVLKMIDLMPRWTPGLKNGLPVPVRYCLPVKFHVD